ncbi:MAG: S1 RNA-binding domain-containing protein, partial [Solirubrobacteraceae bacterium]
AFVEILDGVEGLVHISELAAHHVENPREVVAPGDPVKVKVLEIDDERRRLSLSVKRVEGQVLPTRTLEDGYDEVTDEGYNAEDYASSYPADEPVATADAGTELVEGEIDAIPDAEIDEAAPAAEATEEAPAAEATEEPAAEEAPAEESAEDAPAPDPAPEAETPADEA